MFPAVSVKIIYFDDLVWVFMKKLLKFELMLNLLGLACIFISAFNELSFRLLFGFNAKSIQ